MKKIAVISVIVILALVAGFLGLMYSQSSSKLTETQNQLTEKTVDLIQKTSELSSIQSELTIASNNLADTEKDLNSTKERLNQTASELETTQTTLSNTKDDLIATRSKTNTLQTQIDLANAKIVDANIEKNKLIASISLYKETFGEVFQGVVPNYVVNDSTPPAWGSQGPFNAPLRFFNIVNNDNAKNPTYQQILDFLKTDKTDTYRYVTDYYMCGNFAETLHNRAEAAGIRTGMVFIQFNRGLGHAIDAFLTTDRGLIYIDDTGTDTPGPSSMDSIVTGLKIHSIYYPTFLFPSNYYFLPQSKTVTDLEIYW